MIHNILLITCVHFSLYKTDIYIHFFSFLLIGILTITPTFEKLIFHFSHKTYSFETFYKEMVYTWKRKILRNIIHQK